MAKPIIIHDYKFNNELCSYCQDKKAKFAYKNGKFCCEEFYTSCPEIRRKNSEAIKINEKSISHKKSERWYEVMKSRRGNGKNQHTKAKELGLDKAFVSLETKMKISNANRGRKHSQESKDKISKSRMKFLQENPNMVPYKQNHYSKGPSYAERYFTEVFKNKGIKFETEKQIGLYSLDFTFPGKMIDLEINGDQHYLDDRIVESDIRRTKYLENLGYEVITVKWSDYQKLSKKDKEIFIKTLIRKIS